MPAETNKNGNQVLTFPVAAPFDIAYKHSKTATPVGPHSHNAVELYFSTLLCSSALPRSRYRS